MANVLSKPKFFESIGYVPHPRQQLYHACKARFRIPVCGRRFGKSIMAGRDLEPELFQEKKRYWAVGPTYDLAEKEFRVVWDDLIIGKQLGRDKRVKKAYNKRSGEMYIEFPWQTRFECRSASHPETLVGEALDGVILSEAAKHNPETWERFIRPSLADKRGWATMPTTPEGMNWLYLLWRLGQNPEYEDYASWQFPSWENIAVYPGAEQDPEIQLLKLTMSTEEFAQEIAALFTSFVGRIYHEFDERVHVSKQVFNPAWPNYIGFDFGYTNPLAAVEFQVDPWDGIHVWREHYMSYKSIDEHISMLQNRAQPPGYRLDLCFGDAADPEAVAVLNRDFAPTLALPEAKQNWKQGVEVVKRFLKSYPVGEADEYGTPLMMPKLQIDYSCIHTILEFNSYKKKKSATSPTESNKVGAALKQDDHALDALRYALVHIFELGATYHLADTLGSGDLATVGSDSGYFTSDMRF